MSLITTTGEIPGLPASCPANLRDRLVVSRELLAESGSIFVQIGDENVHVVRSLLDEVFGSENFISLITFRKTSQGTGEYLAGTADYILWYARSRNTVKFRSLYRDKEVGGQGAGQYTRVEGRDGGRRIMAPAERRSSRLPEGNRPFRGLDVYDPTTGQVRSSSTDDIACWFVDTKYNEESLFVREAYFTGAGDPYASLLRALRADIDEAAWTMLYRTESRPFPPPEAGKIAVKVINHHGDEVMKVYDVV